jgi:hypothetical protein
LPESPYFGGEAELGEGAEGEAVEGVAVGAVLGGELVLGHVGGLLGESSGTEGEAAEAGIMGGSGYPRIGEGLGESVVVGIGGSGGVGWHGWLTGWGSGGGMEGWKLTQLQHWNFSIGS